MGKVIPFGRRPVEHRPAVPARGSSEQSFASLIGGIEVVFTKLGIESDSTLKIRMHLNSLVGHISKNSIVTGRSVLRDFTLEELQEIAKNSTSEQWSTKPGYFQALIDEIDSRARG